MVEFRILGALEAVAGREELPLGSVQQRAVLAFLLVHSPEPTSRDRLIDALWGERPPASAPHALQVYASGIRKALRSAGNAVAVRSSPAGYVLEVDAERIDARRFERLIEDAQRVLGKDPAGAQGLFERALSLWRGRPLAEFEQFEWARRETDRLEELRAVGLEGLVEARLAAGGHGEVIGTLTGLVAANPLRERPRRLLMLALYRCGRHAEALAAYRDACGVLDEIGLQPGPELRRLEEAILRHDASLAPHQSAVDVSTRGAGHSAIATQRPVDAASTVAVKGVGGIDRPEMQRKVVTALFSDVSISSALGEELDPEVLQGVMSRCLGVLRSVIGRHGGAVDRPVGDTTLALFGVPRVREDDALRAVRAVVEIRDRLPAVAEELGVTLMFRAAVNTGQVVVGEGENLAIGDAVNVAVRLEQAAASGEILLGEQTLPLVRDAVRVEPIEPVAVKGKSNPVAAFRLLELDPLAPGLKRHLEVPLVGRGQELGMLCAVWQHTIEESHCQLFTLLGTAGVGKSRLAAELFSLVGDQATVLGGRCLHYGDGITFWPLIEALTPAGEPAHEVLERLGGGGAATPEELFFEVRRLLESLALERPVILHLDDLQWAEPMLLDLLDHVAVLSRGAPILLLCTARPELLDACPTWGGGKLNATSALLEPLSAADCELLLGHVGNGLTADARARVIAASEGNPLFLEEMAALAREHDIVTVPSTIQALLAARLEQLPREERRLLERAAIEGEVFHLQPLSGLAGEATAARLDSRLAALVHKELIRPHPATLKGDQAYRFRHLLIRDAAYDSLPKATRARLHERFASWLEQNAGDAAEVDEIAGWHLEHAVHYQRDLAQAVDQALTAGAVEHLYAAGRRAAQRGDTNAARNLLGRAYALAPEGHVQRVRIGVDLAEQLIEGEDLTRVDELLSTAEHNDATAAAAQLVRSSWTFFAGAVDDKRSAEGRLPSLIAQLVRGGDEQLLAKAHLVAVQVNWQVCRFSAATECARLAAEHARNAGDDGLRARALGWYAGSLSLGPAPPAIMAQELDALEQSEHLGPYVAAFVCQARGEVARLSGDVANARKLMHEAIERFRSLGSQVMAAGCYQQLAHTEIQAGDPRTVLDGLLEADAILAELGERGFRSTVQAMIAVVHTFLRAHAAASKAIELSDELGGPDDVVNQAITHAVRAHLALMAGDGVAAERWARSAATHAARIDNPSYQGYAQLELAHVLYALGRATEATAEARQALTRFEAKGDQAGICVTHELLTSSNA
jgi:class 3 adenylate cyclase/tetratricopeptide (TPR) repeat protein